MLKSLPNSISFTAFNKFLMDIFGNNIQIKRHKPGLFNTELR